MIKEEREQTEIVKHDKELVKPKGKIGRQWGETVYPLDDLEVGYGFHTREVIAHVKRRLVYWNKTRAPKRVDWGRDDRGGRVGYFVKRIR